MSIIGTPEMRKIAEEIHAVSSKIAQEVFMERRSLILLEIAKLTGQDYTSVIPAIRKGRPAKNKDVQTDEIKSS